MSERRFLVADWPAPVGVRALVTTRDGGRADDPLGNLNLATHVGEAPAAVLARRNDLMQALAVPAMPLWLNQVHGATVVRHPGPAARGSAGPPLGAPTADAAVTEDADAVLAVLTADCLPVALTSRDGRRLGLAHAGWRGLAAGVLEATVAALGVAPHDLMVWLGPAIEPAAFEVGAEVREAFLARDRGAGPCFVPNTRGRYQADLEGLARRALAALGVTSIHGGGFATFGDAERWYSHRRDPGSGRMATLLWRSAASDGKAPAR